MCYLFLELDLIEKTSKYGFDRYCFDRYCFDRYCFDRYCFGAVF